MGLTRHWVKQHLMPASAIATYHHCCHQHLSLPTNTTHQPPLLLLPPTTDATHHQWVVSVVGGGDGWWRIMSISLIIIYVLHIINFNIIPHEANFQPDAAPRVADNNRSTENWWFTWSNLRRRSSDPNSSSEGNRTLLAATSSESITRLLVVCVWFPSLDELGSKLLL